jgi:hypothetical protein
MELLSTAQSRTRLRIGSAAALLIVAAGVWVLFTFPPASTPYYPKCAFRSLTGFDCPGCGTTRALHHLLHGRVEEAFLLNPMLFAIMIAAACAVPSLVRGERPGFLSKPWFGWGSLVVVCGWWVVRNL